MSRRIILLAVLVALSPLSITRVNAEHLRLVADEADPMPTSDRVTLRINGNGTYSALYRRVTQVGRAPLRE